MDPGGGAWFLEDLTAKLAQSAWARFQEIERAGGISDALTQGLIASQIETTWAEREKNLARRRDPLTGVSEFPNIAEDLPPVPEPDLAAIHASVLSDYNATAVSLPPAGRGERTAAAIRAANAGANLGALIRALGGSTTRIKPFPRRRFGEAFEALRRESDARAAQTGTRPSIFLANLGDLETYAPRAAFAKNAFEAGGLQAADKGGFTDAAALVAMFQATGARLACLCSSDKVYVAKAESMARALKQAGCAWLALAGNPGEMREAYAAAGIDDFIALENDLLSILKAAWAALD